MTNWMERRKILVLKMFAPLKFKVLMVNGNRKKLFIDFNVWRILDLRVKIELKYNIEIDNK